MGKIQARRGNFAVAEQSIKTVLAGCEGVLEPSRSLSFCAIERLSCLYYSMGRLEEAMEKCQQAIDGFEKIYGSTHLFTLNAVSNMGYFLATSGRLDEAVAMYNRAITGFEATPEQDLVPTSMASTLLEFGNLLFHTGRDDEAEKAYLRALEMYLRTYGKAHDSTLLTMKESLNCITNMAD